MIKSSLKTKITQKQNKNSRIEYRMLDTRNNRIEISKGDINQLKERNAYEKMWSVLFDVSVLSGVQKRWRAVEDFSQIKDKNIEIGGNDYEQKFKWNEKRNDNSLHTWNFTFHRLDDRPLYTKVY